MKYLFFLILLFVGTLNLHSQEWFAFNPEGHLDSSAIDMSDWLDKPAGNHGFLEMKGDHLEFEDGTPVKFWGVNMGSNTPFPDSEKASQYVRFMSKYGINVVRFHKFTWEATDGVHSTVITDDKWSRLDYFSGALREAGIYYGWSHIYGHRVLPGDSSRLLAYDEVGSTSFPWAHLSGSSASLVNFADDLQVLNIELTVNMLNHVNPQTGLRYADDPALAFIELQNEDNIFWGAMEASLDQTPTYRALLCKKFSNWLNDKYGSQEALEKAWRGMGLEENEHIDKKNIYPHPNHHAFTAACEAAQSTGRNLPQFWVDRAFFLYEEQTAFYQKFVQAIRDTGYKGVIVGSCWQAGSGITHLLNLHADYKVGPIDRHNYSGGGRGHSLKPGPLNNDPSVRTPGSGLLSTGLQQVKDRPFQISEWMALIPNEWTAEASPIIAAYGMGLQGWDASHSFALGRPHFTPTIQAGRGIYNVTTPTQLSLYPALSAMIYRGDIREGDIIADRHYALSDLREGQLPNLEKISQQYDIKDFQSAVPTEALAMGRVVLSFSENSQVDLASMDELWDRANKVIKSTTGQLEWHYGDHSYFTINSDGTQGAVGFMPYEKIRLQDINIESDNQFAIIIVSSLDPEKSIQDSKRLLVTTIARARNRGMVYNDDHTELLDIGEPPIELEPVNFDLQVKRANPTIHVLDHVGKRTGRKIEPQNDIFHIKGEQEKTIYYEIIFP